MNLLRWFTGLFSGGGGESGRILPIYVLSRRCNEPIAGQVDLYNELSQDEDETGYYCRKVLHTSGESRCFDQVEVNIWFDSRKNMTENEVVGGRWLSEAEYEQELVRFRTPPDTDEDVLPSLAEDSAEDQASEDQASSEGEDSSGDRSLPADGGSPKDISRDDEPADNRAKD